MLAIDPSHEEIRKGNRNQRYYGAWTKFAFLGTRNEPDMDLVHERQVLKTTEMKQLRGSLRN